MTTDVLDRSPPAAGGFRHEALFYGSEHEFVSGVSEFVLDGLAAAEPTLVVVARERIGALQDRLGPDDLQRVWFVDMAEVCVNPARMIPAWRDFVDRHAGGGSRVRGVGEPVRPDRGVAELVECQRHESLLNLAFAGTPAWWLLCPYDTAALPRDVIDEACRSHPFVARDGRHGVSASYRGLEGSGLPFDEPLAEPATPPVEVQFEATSSMSELRSMVGSFARRSGIEVDRAADVVLAVSELAANSLRHGEGRGTLRMWNEPAGPVWEVEDSGTIDHPLAGRVRPPAEEEGGRGLWLVNQLCDLVQLRSLRGGTVIRVHMWNHLEHSPRPDRLTATRGGRPFLSGDSRDA